MAAASVLLLLGLHLGYGSASAEYGFCADQPESLRVRIGGSVTIPCTFSYPRTLVPDKVNVYWRASTGDRCGSAEYIYNHTEKQTHKNYTNRITLVGDPKARSATIRIDNLTERDGDQKYCCRVHITLQNSTNKAWQNRHMTKLEFVDTPNLYYVNQPNVFLALVGTSVTIPCISRYPDGFDSVMEFSVTWKAGLKDLCTEIKDIVFNNGNKIHNYLERVKLVADATGNKASSLHIENLQVRDSKRYCCILNPTKDHKLSLRAHADLIVGDREPIAQYSVEQVKRTEAQVDKNITVSCNITHPDDWHLLGIEIYWRVGVEWGKFAYHPNEESIHPDYRGRTRLTGDPRQRSSASLEITHVTDVDNETYYCLVVFRFCNGNNTFKSVLHQGEGTLLIVKDAGPLYTIIWIVAVLFLLTILILLFVLLKKGLILKCSKARDSQTPSGNRTSLDEPAAHKTDSTNAVYAVVSKSNKRNKGEEPIVYASLELETRTEVKPSPKSGPKNDIVYSAVTFK